MNSEISQQRLVGSSQNFKTLSGPIWSILRIKIETTSHRRQPQIIKIEISQQTIVGSFPKIKQKLRGQHWSVQRKMKTTLNGRPPPRQSQNMNSKISQQPLFGSFFKFKFKWTNLKCTKSTSNGRWHQIIKSEIS